MVVALAVHIVYFPLEAAFNYSPGSSSIEMVVEMVFFLDFLLNLNTAYINKRGQLVSDRRQIALQYLGGWFLVDMVSSLPVEWMRVRHDFVYDLIGRTPRILHTIRLVRFAWFLRLDQSERNVLSWPFYSRYSHLLRIAWAILALTVVAHCMAGCWRLLVTSKVPTSILEDYVSCYYDVLQLLQGQGVPTTCLPQNVFAAVATLARSLVLAIVFGNVGILVSNFNANATSCQHKMESVFAIMTMLQLPTPLRERIHQYYEHLWREYESLDGEIVAYSKGLSHTLQLEVVLFKYMDLIMKVPFWRDTSPEFQKQLMLSLHVRVFLPDDFIIRRGEVGNEFFMINRGICELVLRPDRLETTTFEALVDEDFGSDKASSRLRSGRVSEGNSTSHKLCFDKVQAPPASGRSGGKVAQDQFPHSRLLWRGQTFGELALLMNYERTSNVRALTYVEMCVLKREDVQRIFVKHPKARRSVITDLLVRAMESNEMHNVLCPLKAMIQNALPVEDHTRLSPMHAALMIAAAIDEQRDDDSIKFGVGPSLQQRLYEMFRGQREQNNRQNSSNAPDAAPDSVHHAPDSSGENQNHENRLREAMNRIESLEATQVQVLQLVQDMHAEVHELRRAHATAMHASSSPVSGEVAVSAQDPALRYGRDDDGQGNRPSRVMPDSAKVFPLSAATQESVCRSEHWVARGLVSKSSVPSTKPAVVVPNPRPKLRGRRASFHGVSMTTRLIPRSLAADLAPAGATSGNPKVHDDTHHDERISLRPQHPHPQLVRRPSLLTPLRALMGTLAPESVPTSSSPYADQLFHASN